MFNVTFHLNDGNHLQTQYKRQDPSFPNRNNKLTSKRDFLYNYRNKASFTKGKSLQGKHFVKGNGNLNKQFV